MRRKGFLLTAPKKPNLSSKAHTLNIQIPLGCISIDRPPLLLSLVVQQNLDMNALSFRLNALGGSQARSSFGGLFCVFFGKMDVLSFLVQFIHISLSSN